MWFRYACQETKLFQKCFLLVQQGQPYRNLKTCKPFSLRCVSSSSSSSSSSLPPSLSQSAKDENKEKNIRMYRILSRQCEELYDVSSTPGRPAGSISDDGLILLQEPLAAREYGDAKTYPTNYGLNDPVLRLVKLYMNLIGAEQEQLQKQYDHGDDDFSMQFGFLRNNDQGNIDENIANFIDLFRDNIYIKKSELEEFKEQLKETMEQEEEIHDLKLQIAEVEKRIENLNNEDYDDDSSLLSELRAGWASKEDLKRAIQFGFVQPLLEGTAIQAVRILNEQASLLERTVITTNNDMGIRVVATSQYIGGSFHLGEGAVSALGSQVFLGEQKYRFAYRIRVENLPSNNKSVQLLGRTWNIQELNEHGHFVGDPVHVYAPTTGAVGHLPVIHPGETFCYTSGCELETEKGTMDGCFHMAVVDPETAQYAMVGDPNVTPLREEYEGTKFEMPVGPFPLVYPRTN